jgi:hypothetical protein
MSPLRSKADLKFFENWIELLQCEGLKDTQRRHLGDLKNSRVTTQTSRSRHECVNVRFEKNSVKSIMDELLLKF